MREVWGLDPSKLSIRLNVDYQVKYGGCG